MHAVIATGFLVLATLLLMTGFDTKHSSMVGHQAAVLREADGSIIVFNIYREGYDEEYNHTKDPRYLGWINMYGSARAYFIGGWTSRWVAFTEDWQVEPHPQERLKAINSHIADTIYYRGGAPFGMSEARVRTELPLKRSVSETRSGVWLINTTLILICITIAVRSLWLLQRLTRIPDPVTS